MVAFTKHMKPILSKVINLYYSDSPKHFLIKKEIFIYIFGILVYKKLKQYPLKKCLFGGGGSISFYALDNYRFNVNYNELNSHVSELVKYLQANRILEPKFYEWVTREKFFEQINKADADWYSANHEVMVNVGEQLSSAKLDEIVNDINGKLFKLEEHLNL